MVDLRLHSKFSVIKTGRLFIATSSSSEWILIRTNFSWPLTAPTAVSIARTRSSPEAANGCLGTVYGSAQFREYRYTMTQLDGGHLRILVELLKDGKYEKHSDVTYERTSRTSAPQIE